MLPGQRHHPITVCRRVELDPEPVDLVEDCVRVALFDPAPALDNDENVAKLHPQEPRRDGPALRQDF